MTEADRLILEEMMANTDAASLDRHAKIVHDFYLAYKKAGFTPNQAIILVKHMIETSIKIARMEQPSV